MKKLLVIFVLLCIVAAIISAPMLARAYDLPTPAPTEIYPWYYTPGAPTRTLKPTDLIFPTPTPLNYVWETWAPYPTQGPTDTPGPTWTPMSYPGPGTLVPYPGPGVNVNIFPIFSFKLWLPKVVR